MHENGSQPLVGVDAVFYRFCFFMYYIYRNEINSVFVFLLHTAAIIPAIMIVLASYAGCNRLLVVVWFTLAMGFMGTFYPGMKVNPLDLSPNYAGSLMAVTNGIGALTGVAAPTFVGFMTPHVCISSSPVQRMHCKLFSFV